MIARKAVQTFEKNKICLTSSKQKIMGHPYIMSNIDTLKGL